MSDLDKLFENAPEYATEIVKWGNNLTWANETMMYSLLRESWVERESGWNTIATRPQPERKTVEDVVASNPDGWNYLINPYPGSRPEGKQLVLYSLDSKEFHKGSEGFDARVYQKVCTREELEFYVSAKTKSKPEWTHVTSLGKCKIIKGPNEYSEFLVEFEEGAWEVLHSEKLKPIKPTITEHKALDLMKTMCPDEWAAVERKYTITN